MKKNLKRVSLAATVLLLLFVVYGAYNTYEAVTITAAKATFAVTDGSGESYGVLVNANMMAEEAYTSDAIDMAEFLLRQDTKVTTASINEVFRDLGFVDIKVTQYR